MGMVAAFLLKDLVLLTVSVYLLKQDVERVIAARDKPTLSRGFRIRRWPM